MKENESFESSLLKLESIVKELESGNIELDKMVDKYKEANDLLKFCDNKLKSATRTINKVLNDEGTFSDFETNE